MINSKCKGFTLVELLIVIVVIGVLSAMMMLSSTESVSSAKAAKIISDLTSVKKATLAWYADNLGKIRFEGNYFYINNVQYNSIQDALIGKKQGKGNWVNKIDISRYLDKGAFNEKGDITEGAWDYLQEGGYGINDAGKNARRSTWFAGYKFNTGENAVKEKLWNKKNSLGLIFSKTARPNASVPIDKKDDLKDATTVWLKILGNLQELDGKE